MTSAVLAVEGLVKRFHGVEAVRGVSLEVAAGEAVALIGPNGAGKTTCFNLIGGQLKPDAGRIRLDAEDVTGTAPRLLWQRGVARTFQITAAFTSMTVRENVQIALNAKAQRIWHVAGRMSARFREEADEILSRVGMREQAERPCAILAYGDLKRIELAIALAGKPRLLLMDEPTAGMAPGERVRLMALAANLAKREGIAVLFTEHDMDVVFAHADRIIVLDRGAILAEGEPEAIRADPAVRAVYLGAGLASGGH
ncbi:amino acid/amide ABC transporter ATP-binding protein 1, HAAT family [Rhizobiales bacterium GAS113]|nr:amino acid/amide ABC transporter ATP-binding protein 1, HAAT family [Rhizobiales bacterium GAS113]